MLEKQQFTLYPRKRKNKKPVYYVRFRLPDGAWSSGKNSGQTSKSAAAGWAVNYLKGGQIVQYENITLQQFGKGFFLWSGDWATNLKVTGKRISRRQCLEKTALLNNHIIPALGKIRLTELDRYKIEKFRNRLFNLGLTGSTINKVLSCIRAILEAAENQRLIQAVPKIERVGLNARVRGILAPEEVRAVFAFEWPEIRAFAANFTAAVTGLRQSEILGLQRSAVRDGYLEITRAWNQKMNTLNSSTKTGQSRYVPVPRQLLTLFARLADISPWQAADAFVFFTPNSSERPMQGRLATRGLYDALKQIGVTPEQRKARRIDFHSWRHWFNSMLINKRVPLQKVQAVTGHLTDQMTANYYHPDDMADIRAIQEGILELPS